MNTFKIVTTLLVSLVLLDTMAWACGDNKSKDTKCVDECTDGGIGSPNIETDQECYKECMARE